MLLAFTLATGLVALAWAGITAACIRAALTVPHLEDDTSPDPSTWPSVSLLVPARDEAHGVEAALRSKLAIDYPALEVIFVDDRSSDDTGAIADALAKEDARLKVVHLTELPDGWLGKVHALHRAAEVATGDWLLPSDADIHFAPDTLKLAVRRCLAKGHDVLAAFPRFRTASWLIDAVLGDFARTVLAPMQVDKIEDPSNGFGVGVGVFTLIRRDVYQRSEGWPHLRLEIADDVTLGSVLKAAGGRCSLVLARSHLSLQMYPTLTSLWSGVVKSACTMSQYRAARHAPILLAMLALDVVPWLALGLGWHLQHAALLALGGAAAALGLLSAAVAISTLGQPAWKAVLSPLGAVLFHAMLLVGGLRNYARGFVTWRGTPYPIAQLREGSRFKMPWQQ